MTWSKFDDEIDGHPKLRRAGLDGFGLWARAIIYSNKFLTDGYIDAEWLEEKVPARKDRDKIVARLVELGLFEPNGQGYRVHDFHDHNPSRVEVLDRRKRAAEKKEKQRLSPDLSPGDIPRDSTRDDSGDAARQSVGQLRGPRARARPTPTTHGERDVA